MELIEGSRGVYDIRVDGELLYSKHERGGRFPDEEREILAPLRQR